MIQFSVMRITQSLLHLHVHRHVRVHVGPRVDGVVGLALALVLARPELDAFKADAVAARRKPGLIAGLVLLLAGMACGAVGGAVHRGGAEPIVA